MCKAILTISVVTKVKAKSRELRFCKSRVCFCLSYIGRKDLAYAIYQVSDDKLDFTNDVYGWLKQFSDNDSQLKSIIQSKKNEYDQGERKDNDCIDELIEFNNEKVYHEIISKSPCKKIRYDDRFIRTRLMTADRYFSELKFAELPECTKGLRMLIYSYHSPEAFYSVPSDVDGNTYLKFILEQFSCSRIEDTIFYKTVAEVSKVGTEYNSVAFYNDIYALKSIVNLIINQKKALKAHNVSELNLLLTAMRAIVMVCSSKEELNLKTPVSKFVKFIEERDKIDTRLTVSEDYFTSLINAYNNFKAEIKGTLCIPPIAHSEKNN